MLVVWYITNGRVNVLRYSVDLMSSYDWVNRIVVLHTSMEDKSIGSDNEKVVEYWADFGVGFEKSPKEGGFDEIMARNCAVVLSEQFNPTWLLQCDSDEIYTYETGSLLNLDVDVVWLACYPMLSPSTYSKWSLHKEKRLLDPHPRLFRPGLRFSYNRDFEFLKGHENYTIHCCLDILNNSREYVTKHGEYFHLHLKPMIEKWEGPFVDVGRDLFRKWDF